MKQTNNVSPLLGWKPPAVGALPHPVTHSSSVHPQTLEDLLCIRYRYDPKGKRRLKTVELIVEETPWQPVAGKIALNHGVGHETGTKNFVLSETLGWE